MISKNKIMLQIPVEKQMASEFKAIAKKTGVSQGELFEHAFSLFVYFCRERNDKDGQEKN